MSGTWIGDPNKQTQPVSRDVASGITERHALNLLEFSQA